ncbi:MAG: hypothetical protein HW403_245 [Dehalococcoidia bacterium]|nr:hypothetical protein [Dehalococcoidia bacterium]
MDRHCRVTERRYLDQALRNITALHYNYNLGHMEYRKEVHYVHYDTMGHP